MGLAVGQTIHGYKDDYRVESILAEGGFAIVYAAVRARDDEDVVLKELRLERISNWKSLELFQREADALRNLSHPRIPEFYELFAWDGERARDVASLEVDEEPPCLVLAQKRIRGVSLAEKIADKNRLTPKELEKILRGTLAILQHLHSLHPPVIHRDIHPGNIVISDDGEPALVDFGTPNSGHTRKARTLLGNP